MPTEQETIKEPVATEESTPEVVIEVEKTKEDTVKDVEKNVDEVTNEEPKVDNSKDEDNLIEDDKVKELNSEIERLKSELETKKDLEKTISDLTAQVEKLKIDNDNTVTKAKNYEDVLNGMLTTRLSNVSDDVKALMPTNTSVNEQLAWLDKAEEVGIIKASKKDIEIGKPLSPKTPTERVDTSKLSASSILTMAYSSKK